MLLPVCDVVTLMTTIPLSEGLKSDTPFWLSTVKLQLESGCRSVTSTMADERPYCLGTKWTLLPHGMHFLPSPEHFLQWRLYVMSPLPPVSLGGDHSKVTQVSFTVEMGFSGAEGGPEGRQRPIFLSVLIQHTRNPQEMNMSDISLKVPEVFLQTHK